MGDTSNPKLTRLVQITLCLIIGGAMLASILTSKGTTISGRTIIAQQPWRAGYDLKGWFTIQRDYSADAFIGTGSGGACMIADLNKFDIPSMPAASRRTCTKSSDCYGGLLVHDPPQPYDWAGYCASDHRCWVRPGGQAELCQISGLNGPIDWPIDDHAIHPYDLRPFNFVHPESVRWRVVACLNGFSADGKNRDCGTVDGPDRLEVFGDPRLIQSTL